ncbi:vesicle-associated membrane protein-associated protein A-like [Lytechinus variegatus]|uniref:vesicle-associated membrane protein-associated protein A-like n=1 Tax=Lytechinus variegatus TaxID=7654 RepID=UPI001BB10494|nr:vesicle-associated membrane protein-associated protein A-like [Lytechinus variegatus]
MSKPDQLLTIKPPTELRFRGPFTDVVTSELTLSNPSDKILCFKIKTTAPRRYCVRPNSGVMVPNQNVTVSVMLQPFDFDPNEKNKHKFMVQSIVIPKADIDLEAVWKASDTATVMDTKLKCVFEWPANQAPAPVSQEKVEAAAPENKPIKSTAPQVGEEKLEMRDLDTVVQECKQLRREVGSLRAENTQLRTDGVRQRRVEGGQPMKTVSPTVTETKPMLPSTMIILAIFILGFLIGKYLF